MNVAKIQYTPKANPSVLTEKERDVFDYLVKFVKVNHFQPSTREMAEALGYRGADCVALVLNGLEHKGWVVRKGDRAGRNIQILKWPGE